MSELGFEEELESESSVTSADEQQAAFEGPGGVVIGVLVGLRPETSTALVIHPGQSGSTALAAGSIVDLQGQHIGRRVVLMFEGGDPRRPIVMGLLRPVEGWPLPEQPAQVEVEADGERLLLTTKEQLVLRCGKASITLTKAGKVLIQGTYVSHRSSGVMRIKGGSVQLN